MEFDKVIRERYSCRKFSDKEVTKDVIEKILEAGRIAPTAKNIQPVKIYVISSKEGLAKIDKASPCRYNAPVVLLVCADKDKAYTKRDGIQLYMMDASIVTTHMMLEATNIGVDNIWIELFDGEIIRNEFNIPSNLEPVCMLPIGYKEDDCTPGPLHSQRKELNEIVVYED